MNREELENLEGKDLERQKAIEEIEKLKLERRELGRPVFLRPGVLLGLVTTVVAGYSVFFQYGASKLNKQEAEVAALHAKLDVREAKEKVDALRKEKIALEQGNEEARPVIARAKEMLGAIIAETRSTEQKASLASVSRFLDTALRAIRIRAHLHSVFFLNELEGWAVGDEGTILATTDAGKTWTPQKSGTRDDLYSVHFANENTGWAVGWSGTILVTTDAGDTWFPRSSGTEYQLSSVYFANENTGWVVGTVGHILATTDAGRTWTTQDSGSSSYLESVHFANENTGWAVGSYGTILATTDAGRTWTEQTPREWDSEYGEWLLDFVELLRSVHFANETTGWVVGEEGTILVTTDAGETWTQQVSGTTERLESVHFFNENTGWAVGGEGTILHTMDGGQSWVSQNP